jgi:hypothetical protein
MSHSYLHSHGEVEIQFELQQALDEVDVVGHSGDVQTTASDRVAQVHD